ncbi:MAG: hypothetical protein KH366_16575 [Clostridiaceae bacterium]|nr:hypothetical protein [Clostridiaceae bacterium]
MRSCAEKRGGEEDGILGSGWAGRNPPGMKAAFQNPIFLPAPLFCWETLELAD